MIGVIESIVNELVGVYSSFISSLPPFAGEFVNLFLLVLLIVLYSVFIWKIHKFIAQKNILELNLNQYNKSEHPFFAKIWAGLLYFIEYIIILPFLVFIWFSVFTFFLVVLSGGTIEVKNTLIISAIIVAAIRMTAYHSRNLSREVAKLLPFNLLAFFILNFTSFDVIDIIKQISKIPLFLESIIIYFVFIIILELILRFFDFILSLFGIEKVSEAED
ncbi:MAG: hypothetical protein WC584_05080 [Candidatus Pacearchaeota archaeon]